MGERPMTMREGAEQLGCGRPILRNPIARIAAEIGVDHSSASKASQSIRERTFSGNREK